ncbi:hypothetical protein D046_4436B, partial [Vibrio parahaemolyticus V-223/04]
FTDWLQ